MLSQTYVTSAALRPLEEELREDEDGVKVLWRRGQEEEMCVFSLWAAAFHR